MLFLLSLLSFSFTLPPQTPTIDWKDNRLILRSDRVPGVPVETWWLEAFCKTGSTKRKWEETTIPHKTERLDGTGPAPEIRLRSTLDNGVIVEHRLRTVPDGVTFDLTLRNPTKARLDVDWAQPCTQVAGFTGRTQDTYLDRAFIFTEGTAGIAPAFLSDLPRTEEAVYRGGQVFVPRPVNLADVNPRPISTVRPAAGLIGCVSADGKSLLAIAWDHTQELFQGIITCIHSDMRIGGLKPGEPKRLRGRLYLMENDTARLLSRYQRDFPNWRRDMGVPPQNQPVTKD
jgi:hypothetical protein